VRRHGVRAFLQYGGVLVVAVCLNFALPRLAPGDVVDYLFPPEQSSALSPEQRARVLAQFGLDEPLPQQFQRYVAGIARGDLMVSVRYGSPVRDLLVARLGWTLLLVGGAVVLSTIAGTLLGFSSAWRRGSSRDAGTLTSVMLVDSMPPFFVGMLMILLFSVTLGWLPTFGARAVVPAVGLAAAGEVLQRLVLPLVTLTLASIGPIYLVARSALVSELAEDYVLMAEAKGLTPRQVRRHAQRNALVPVATVAAIGMGTLVGGAAVVETVFAYPGLGRLIYESVLARDYPVLQGAFLLLAIGVIVANLLVDLLYPVLDPRVRRPRAAAG
jgi:peptide/nickel transport system permease protein